MSLNRLGLSAEGETTQKEAFSQLGSLDLEH